MRGIPTGAAQRLPDVAERILQHEAAHARAGIEHGQDEQRLEHDGEVVPDRHQRLPAQAVEKMCAMPTAKAGAPPVRLKSVCSPTAWASACISAAVTGNPQLLMVAAAASGAWPTMPAGTVDREIDARLQHAGGDHRHDGDQRFGQHRAVADHARLGLARDQLGRGAAGDQRMKAADGAAGDGDEAKGKILPANTGPVPSMKRVSAGMCSVGRSATMPSASMAIVPSFTKVLR